MEVEKLLMEVEKLEDKLYWLFGDKSQRNADFF